MASGFPTHMRNGVVGRCFPIFQDFSLCVNTTDDPRQCVDFRDDYLECIHNQREVYTFFFFSFWILFSLSFLFFSFSPLFLFFLFFSFSPLLLFLFFPFLFFFVSFLFLFPLRSHTRGHFALKNWLQAQIMSFFLFPFPPLFSCPPPSLLSLLLSLSLFLSLPNKPAYTIFIRGYSSFRGGITGGSP